MRKFLSTKAAGVLTALALLCALVGFVGWKLMTPKIGHATLAQINAVLPPELREDPRIDEAAAKRMDRIIELASKIAGPDTAEFENERTSANRKRELARKIWKAKYPVFQEAGAILSSGPLQVRPVKDLNASRGPLVGEKDLVKFAAQAGFEFARSGDFESAQTALDLANRLAISIFNAGGDLLGYLVSIAVLSVSDAAIQQTVRLPNCPVNLCRHLMAELAPTGIGDPVLGAAINEDFRDSMLPLLANSEKLAHEIINEFEQGDEPPDSDAPASHSGGLFGTFDPIETAKTMGTMVSINIRNAGRLYSDYDKSGDLLADAQSRDLPDSADWKGSGLNWHTLKFKFLMNNSRNSLGRSVFAFGMGGLGENGIVTSCSWRARHQCLRVLIASVLYRRDHGGNLPPALSALVPKYLPLLPLDPFNGKPLLFNASKQVVYAVGQDLVDDGGDIVAILGLPKDIGLSLAISKR